MINVLKRIDFYMLFIAIRACYLTVSNKLTCALDVINIHVLSILFYYLPLKKGKKVFHCFVLHRVFFVIWLEFILNLKKKNAFGLGSRENTAISQLSYIM